MQSIDISDPRRPAALARWSPTEAFDAPRLVWTLASSGGEVALHDDSAWTTPVGGGPVWAVDIGTPGAPTLQATLLEDEGALSVAVAGDTLAVGGVDALHLVDVADARTGQQRVLARHPAPALLDVTWAGGHLWAASDSPVVLRLDAAEPAAPRLVSAWSSGTYRARGAMGLASLADGRVVVAEGSLRTADLSRGPQGRVLDSRSFEYPMVGARDVARGGRWFFVAAGSEGVLAFDVGPQGQLIEVGRVDTPGSAQRLMVEGNTLYVADGEAGLQTYTWTAMPRLEAVGRVFLPRVSR